MAVAKKRRKLLSADDRKARTLERITAVFATKGFAGTTTAELAKASGVSEALLYKLFKTKKGMYREMIRAKLAVIGGGTTAIEPGVPGDDLGFFSGVARVVLERTREDPAFVRLLFFSQLQGDAFVDMFRQAHGEGALGHLEAYVRRRIADGAFRRIEPRLAAWAFMSMTWEYALNRFVFRSPYLPRVKDDVAVATFAELFLRGIRA